MTQRQVFGWTIGLAGGCLAACAAVVFWVDPYFHYRAPRGEFAYFLDNQRSQNDGIVRHFDYDALVTGSSMTENFRASDVERLWGWRTVKVPFSGASFRETSRLVQAAGAARPGLKLAIVGVDYNKLLIRWDWMREDLGSFPDYLYDDNPLTDIKYLLNLDAITKAFRGLWGPAGRITSFDAYSAWHTDKTKYGAAAGLRRTTPEEVTVMHSQQPFTEEDARRVEETVARNFVPMARAVQELVLFITPYSQMRLEVWRRQGRLEKQRAARKAFAEAVLKIPNVRLFCFEDKVEVTGNPDNYSDLDHYGPWVSRQILEWIRAGVGEVLPKPRSEGKDGG